MAERILDYRSAPGIGNGSANRHPKPRIPWLGPLAFLVVGISLAVAIGYSAIRDHVMSWIEYIAVDCEKHVGDDIRSRAAATQPTQNNGNRSEVSK